MTASQPIGLFDSGIGGLTVLRSLMAALPNESFVYLGDTARLPYGTKSRATIEKYVAQNIAFLRTMGVKAIVVACNSASSVLLGQSHSDGIPVYNVIEPGAQVALRLSPRRRIGVLGTRATVAGQAYVQAIHALDRQAQVWQQACPLLVPLVEEGWEDDPITNLVVYRYVAPLMGQDLDSVILGCTHYPVLRDSVRKVLGNGVNLVDSAEAIATMIRADLDSGRLAKAPGPAPSRLKLLATDVSPNFEEVAARLMRPLPVPRLEAVDIAPA